MVAGVCLLSSCGGGVGDQASATGNTGGVGSGGTGSYTNGPISGLGSIIVNGVRYDVSKASVKSDDGGSTLTSSALDLGMQVEVSSGSVTAGVGGALPTALAGEVRIASAVLGPISEAPNSACSCLVVLGQTVKYADATNMPKDLLQGDVVEVFGRPDLSRRVLVATRVQRVTDATRPYKLVGLASGDDIHSGTHTLTVHGPSAAVSMNYEQDSQVSDLRAADGNSRPVRVWLSRDAGAPTLVRLSLDRPLVSDREEASLEGRVTAALADGHLAVNGAVVDVSSLTGEERVQAGKLVPGDRVRLEGRLVAGVFKVTEVHGGDGDEEQDDDEIELHGYPEARPVAVDSDPTSSTITVRGVVVIYKNVDVNVALDLSKLPCVEVEGKAYDGAGRLVAEEIKADNFCRH
jgi:hypothetical protein